MPGVGALAARAIQFQQEPRAVAHRHGRVGNRLTEQVSEGFLALVVEVGLLTKEDHFVLHQRLLDGVDGGGIQVTGQFDATDLGADAASDRVDVQRLGDGLNS